MRCATSCEKMEIEVRETYSPIKTCYNANKEIRLVGLLDFAAGVIRL